MSILRSPVPSVYEGNVTYDSTTQSKFTLIFIFRELETEFLERLTVIQNFEYTTKDSGKHAIPGLMFRALSKNYPYFRKRIFVNKDNTEVHIPVPQVFGSNTGNLDPKHITVTASRPLDKYIITCLLNIEPIFTKPRYEYINSRPILIRQIGNENGIEIPDINFCAIITCDGHYVDSFLRSDVYGSFNNNILHIETKDKYSGCTIEVYQLENREPETESSYFYPALAVLGGLLYYFLRSN